VFENVAKLKYLGVINQSLIVEEIKRTNSDNSCYHSVQNLPSPCLLSKNIRIRIYKTVIVPLVLYVCETWSLTLRGEHSQRVFEKKVVKRIFGSNRNQVT
jgi:hypothetical protein